MKKFVFIILLWVLVPAWPAMAQEIFFHSGIASQIARGGGVHAWGLTYLEGLGEHMAWSLTYINEGHLKGHKRDGFSPQFWGRINVLERRVSLAAGGGPYLFNDTVSGPATSESSIQHGIGVMASVSATLYTKSRFLLQARGNWIWTQQNANTCVATLGVGYQLEKPSAVGPLKGYDINEQKGGGLRTPNEIAVLGGVSVLNQGGNSEGFAISAEYRRNITPYLDWTIGWLNERYPGSRTGPIMQIWAGRSFFHDRLALGFGVGPYLTYDTHGNNSVVRLNWLAGVTTSYKILPRWVVRATFSRVITTNDRDADIFVGGIGYRF